MSINIKVTGKTFDPTKNYLSNAYSGSLDKPILIHKGSTRSTKTYSILQALVLFALENDVSTIDIVRAELATLKKTTKIDLEEILENMELLNDVMHNKTEHTYNINGTTIRLLGANFSKRLKGAKRDILFIDEADALSEKQYDELQQRTKLGIILAYNPVFSNDSHWIGKRVVDKSKIVHSTYKDNSFLSDLQISAIESYIPIYKEGDKEIVDRSLDYNGDGVLISGDPTKWAIQGLGIHAKSPLIIYPHWNIEEYGREKPTVAYGLDIGYTNPSTLVEISIVERINKDNILYINEIFYEKELNFIDIIEKCNQHNVQKDIPIYSDHSPSVIKELQEEGYTVIKAKKDVDDGIDAVKSFSLRISPNSHNLKSEISNYRRKKSNNKPVKSDDHAMDALRYAVYTHIINDKSGNIKKVFSILNS